MQLIYHNVTQGAEALQPKSTVSQGMGVQGDIWGLRILQKVQLKVVIFAD
jgi:hypothetical protein